MEKTTYEYEAHTPKKLKGNNKWLVCTNCGLVYLRNKFTQWAIDKGCLADFHPGYKSARKIK